MAGGREGEGGEGRKEDGLAGDRQITAIYGDRQRPGQGGRGRERERGGGGGRGGEGGGGGERVVEEEGTWQVGVAGSCAATLAARAASINSVAAMAFLSDSGVVQGRPS